MIFNNNNISFSKLCEIMYDKGFEFASHTYFKSIDDIKDYLNLKKPDNCDYKPNNSILYFSPIINKKTTEWKEFSKSWTDVCDRNIIFIKYKKLNILNSKFNIKSFDKTLYKLSIIKQIGFYLIKYNWKKISKNYDGFYYSASNQKLSSLKNSFGDMWDVTTLIIWNFNCIKEIYLFKSIGKNKFSTNYNLISYYICI